MSSSCLSGKSLSKYKCIVSIVHVFWGKRMESGSCNCVNEECSSGITGWKQARRECFGHRNANVSQMIRLLMEVILFLMWMQR